MAASLTALVVDGFYKKENPTEPPLLRRLGKYEISGIWQKKKTV